jgi:hypothetical protein
MRACEPVLRADNDNTDLKTASIEGVVWNLDVEMASYWKEVKTRIQIGVKGEVKNPLIKVWTTRKGEAEVIPGVDLFKDNNGHFFMTSSTCSLRSSNPPVQAAMDLDANAEAEFRERAINQERPSLSSEETGSFSHNTGFVHNNSSAQTKAPKRARKMPPKNKNKDVNDIMGKLNEVGNPLNLQEGEVELGLKIANEVNDNMKEGEQGGNGGGSSKSTLKSNVEGSYQKHLSRGRKPTKGPSVNKRMQGNKRKARPDENWGTYQHMGGDPRMRKAHDLSGAPFEPAMSKKLVSPEDPTYNDAGKDGDTVKSVAEEADTSIKMVNQMTSEEMAMAMGMSDYHKLHRDMHARGMISRMDAGLGFTEEDDYLFVPAVEAAMEAAEAVEENPTPRMSQSRINELLGLAPQNPKVETLRAIGNSLLSPAAPPSSVNNSPYLGALGGVAPPAGMYNNNSPSMASTPGSELPIQNPYQATMASNSGSGLPIQNPYEATMGQSASSSSLTSWPQLATTPTLNFNDTTAPSAESGMGMNTDGGRSSSLGNIARTHSRSGIQSNVGGGASLHAESPASHSATTPSASRNMFTPPVIGPGFHGQQQAVLPGHQYDAPGAPWENGRGYPGQQQFSLPGRQYDAPGAPWENGRGYPGQQQASLQGRQYEAPGAPWENGRGYPGQQQAGAQGQQYGGALEMGRTGSRASDLHGQQGGGSHDNSADVDPLAAAAKKGFGWLN